MLCTAIGGGGRPALAAAAPGRGWMTAEYSLLPASTGERDRSARRARGKQGGRTVEIQRLIGRALRSVCDFKALGERTLWLDCDVLQADGGTRCAAISGAYVAARRALDRFGLSKALTGSVAAVSVGVVDGVPLLDLDYSEDSRAETDMNVVMTGDGRLVEVQATAEREPFTREELDGLLDLAAGGIEEIMVAQDDAVAVRALPDSRPARRCCGCCSPPGSAARSGSSASCATTRRASGPTCSCRSAPALFTLVSAYGWSDWTFSNTRGRRLRPDQDRGADRDRDRLPRGRRNHRRGITVRGLTTAATLWVVAAIGMAPAPATTRSRSARRRSCSSRSARSSSSAHASSRASGRRRRSSSIGLAPEGAGGARARARDRGARRVR